MPCRYPSYEEMGVLMSERAEKLGFVIGARVRYKKRTGIIRRFNPLMFDSRDPAIYVDLDATDKLDARRMEFINTSKLELVPFSTEVTA